MEMMNLSIRKEWKGLSWIKSHIISNLYEWKKIILIIDDEINISKSMRRLLVTMVTKFLLLVWVEALSVLMKRLIFSFLSDFRYQMNGGELL